jgi:hypothetical protein
MAEEASTETPQEPAQSESEQALGDGGKKALDAERRRANAAEKALKGLQQQLDEVTQEKLTEDERIVREREQAIAERDAAKAEALRYRVATRFGISDEDAELFLTGTDEETLTRQAERLAEHNKQPEGLYVPAEGHQPSAPALNSDELETSLRRKLGIA